MDDLEEFKKTFFEESADLLSSAEQKLMELVPGEEQPEALGAIFRAVHSIKGGAGAFGFERLVKFTHAFETVLDALRSGKIALDKARHTLLMQGFDVVTDLVRNAQGTADVPPDREEPVLAGLNDWYPLHGGEGPKILKGGAFGSGATAAEPAGKSTTYIIRFKPHRTVYAKGNEPILLLRQLAALGHAEIACATGAVPTIERMDPEEAYLGWIIQLETEKDETAVREVFEFVDTDCELSINKQTTAAMVLDHSPLEGMALNAGAPVPAKKSEAVKDGTKEGAGGNASSIRVDLDKIDRLVNMVGEIVITQTMVAQQAGGVRRDNPHLANGLEAMRQHTRELQDSVMSIRAQPVKSVFQRLPRLVRELAGALKKEVRLEMSGENTEVDRTVIEQLSDPLTHMIRNSLDHGIEMPDARMAAGKPREGVIHLSAAHRSGRIVIQIEDDGGGINREKVRQKCIEKGLIDAGAAVTDEEIDNFIFLPGLSTADKVSDVSGRGVGMDVVKKNIQALGGRVFVQSSPGKGSRFILSLPLTLAVLDGMIVSVGAERYVVPLTSIIELLNPAPAMIATLVAHGDLLHIRGEYVRLLYVHKAFGIDGAVEDPTRALVVLCELEGDQKIGLVVDKVVGQQQVVIKSIEANYRPIDGVSAATILGDGRVALILDVEGLRQILTGPGVGLGPRGELIAKAS